MKKVKAYSPTMLPDFILTIKGKCNAKHGTEVIDSFVQKLIKRTEAYENGQCVQTEQVTAATRNRAAKLMTDIAKQKLTLADIPDMENETSIRSLRSNRKILAMRNSCKIAIEQDLVELAGLYEEIISADADMAENIHEARRSCESKIYAYVNGARKKLPNYIPQLHYSNDAMDTYYDKHERIDDEIAHTVKTFKDGDSNA